MSEFSEGMAVGQAIGSNGGNVCYPMYPAMYGNNGFCGNGWGDGWWILLLLLCGWGNGNGAWGGNNQFQGYEIGKLATTNDVASGFSTSAIMSNQRENQLSQQQGFADVQQTLCQGFSGVNATVNQVGNTINQGICNLGYNIQGGFNQIGHQISDCCCTTQRAIDGVNYNMAKNTCDIQNTINNSTRDIIDSQRCGTDRILNFLTQQELNQLRAENQGLRFQASQAAQNAYLVNELRPTARPAYITCSPYESSFGYNRNNCGCNSCC